MNVEVTLIHHYRFHISGKKEEKKGKLMMRCKIESSVNNAAQAVNVSEVGTAQKPNEPQTQEAINSASNKQSLMTTPLAPLVPNTPVESKKSNPIIFRMDSIEVNDLEDTGNLLDPQHPIVTIVIGKQTFSTTK